MLILILMYVLSFILSIFALVVVTKHNPYWGFTETELKILFYLSIIPFGSVPALLILAAQWAKIKISSIIDFKTKNRD